MATAKVKLENINHPGKFTSADPAMYNAMKAAILKVLPERSPGLTVAQVQQAVVAHLPGDLFPGGAKSGWWMRRCSSTSKRKASSPARRPRRYGCTKRRGEIRHTAPETDDFTASQGNVQEPVTDTS